MSVPRRHLPILGRKSSVGVGRVAVCVGGWRRHAVVTWRAVGGAILLRRSDIARAGRLHGARGGDGGDNRDVLCGCVVGSGWRDIQAHFGDGVVA